MTGCTKTDFYVIRIVQLAKPCNIYLGLHPTQEFYFVACNLPFCCKLVPVKAQLQKYSEMCPNQFFMKENRKCVCIRLCVGEGLKCSTSSPA